MGENIKFDQTDYPDIGKRWEIEDDLTDTWVEDFAAAGTAELEEYLEKHAAFFDFLNARAKKVEDATTQTAETSVD